MFSSNTAWHDRVAAIQGGQQQLCGCATQLICTFSQFGFCVSVLLVLSLQWATLWCQKDTCPLPIPPSWVSSLAAGLSDTAVSTEWVVSWSSSLQMLFLDVMLDNVAVGTWITTYYRNTLIHNILNVKLIISWILRHVTEIWVHHENALLLCLDISCTSFSVVVFSTLSVFTAAQDNTRQICEYISIWARYRDYFQSDSGAGSREYFVHL